VILLTLGIICPPWDYLPPLGLFAPQWFLITFKTKFQWALKKSLMSL